MVDDSCSIFRNVCGMTFGRLDHDSSMTHRWLINDSCSIFRNVCGMTFGRLAKWWLIIDDSSVTHHWWDSGWHSGKCARAAHPRWDAKDDRWVTTVHSISDNCSRKIFSWNRVELITRIIFASRTKVWIVSVAEIYAIKVGEWTLLTKIFSEFSNYSNGIHLISTRWSFLSLAPKRESLPLLR